MELNIDDTTLTDNVEDKSFILIDGTFDVAEAGKVLLSLTNSKINYHTLESLSTLELCGQENINSKNRIDELNNVNVEIGKILREAKDNGKNLKVNAVINIQFF